MKAWEIERLKMDTAIPRILSEEEQTWDFAQTLEKSTDDYLKLMWESHVPGSYAPESLMVAAVQSLENKGYFVEDGDRLIQEGLKALEANDMLKLNEVSGLLWRSIHHAKVNQASFYWRYMPYHDYQHYCSKVQFMPKADVAKDDVLLDKIYAAWLGQIIGGAVGTAIEGYTTKNIKATFGDVYDYVRTPNTYNDDITFELAFLKAFQEKGRALKSEDIALKWLAYIPMAWSAEDIALRNLRQGIFPPESGRFNNPYSDWIGAQMRGAICGMLAPGDAREAARLAWLDAQISHDNNGILGEVFNAVLVALSFVVNDTKTLVTDALTSIPKDSEYYHFANTALIQCQTHETWEEAWAVCETVFKEYNWIHAYPNVMAEIVALWYGKNDFTETLHIIAMCGQDVDCNAAQILAALGAMQGSKKIPTKFKKTIKDRLDTYLRVDKKLSIKQLAKDTFACL